MRRSTAVRRQPGVLGRVVEPVPGAPTAGPEWGSAPASPSRPIPLSAMPPSPAATPRTSSPPGSPSSAPRRHVEHHRMRQPPRVIAHHGLRRGTVDEHHAGRAADGGVDRGADLRDGRRLRISRVEHPRPGRRAAGRTSPRCSRHAPDRGGCLRLRRHPYLAAVQRPLHEVQFARQRAVRGVQPTAPSSVLGSRSTAASSVRSSSALRVAYVSGPDSPPPASPARPRIARGAVGLVLRVEASALLVLVDGRAGDGHPDPIRSAIDRGCRARAPS